MLSRQDKAKKIERFGAWVERSQAILIAENAGLTVQDMETLRLRMRDNGGNAQVMKNTLAKRVLSGGRFDALTAHLSGALIYGVGDDAAKIAKVFTDLARDNGKFIVRGGALPQKEVLDTAAVMALARLPSRDQLLAMLAGTLQAPIAKLAGTLNAVPSGLARALRAVAEQKADSNSGN